MVHDEAGPGAQNDRRMPGPDPLSPAAKAQGFKVVCVSIRDVAEATIPATAAIESPAKSGDEMPCVHFVRPAMDAASRAVAASVGYAARSSSPASS